MEKEKKVKLGGQPRKYESSAALKKAVESYFNNPPTKTITLKQTGEQVSVPFLSITGLALHLGFASRQSFYDNEGLEEFSYILKQARTYIENEYEFILQHGCTVGAIFALKQFGWSDNRDVQQDITINIDHEALGIESDSQHTKLLDS
jgi:hypothetical protein